MTYGPDTGQYGSIQAKLECAMKISVFNFTMELDWKLIADMSAIDRFDASWSSIEKREGQSLKELKTIATVRSVGASTRIEGSVMTDQEVEALLRDLTIDKLVDRDSKEVAGYYETLDLITESYREIPVTVNSIKSLHNTLLKYCDKDAWHRGSFKQLSNNVEAEYADGSRQVIFETTPPGFATDDAIRSLVAWYTGETEVHPLVKCALFSYEFVTIHPFQDGNGRMSRLLSTLLLMQNGYDWVQYVSFEHEIESRKEEYYLQLRKCQAQRPQEDVTGWLRFYFDALQIIQQHLLHKLEVSGIFSELSPRDKAVLTYVTGHSGVQISEIEERLELSNSTAKRVLRKLLELGLIEKYGRGKGTSYAGR